jgi:bifunctional UDP-N-acetylglucosamine pyrophosphorylase/glucosamine-1-phosphate N-acetyltransferase
MKAVVLAAGIGKRMKPFTLTRAKSMLPVANKPLIEHILTCLKNRGFKEALLVLGYKGEHIKRYLGDGSKVGMSISYVVQEEFKGTADALSLTESYVGTDSFLTIYGDLFVNEEAVEAVTEKFSSRNAVAVVGVSPVRNLHRFGCVQVKGDVVKKMVEKPEKVRPGDLVNTGIYAFSNKIFDCISDTKLSPRGELELTDSIAYLLKRGELVLIRGEQTSFGYDKAEGQR